MKQKIIIALCCMPLLFLSSCGEKSAVDIRSENRHNLMKIELGMTKAEVVEIMGDKSARVNFGKNAITVTNPYRNEIKKVGNSTYEILYYYTHQDQKDWPFKRFKVLDRELTPIVFENGKVIGWGDDFLNILTNP